MNLITESKTNLFFPSFLSTKRHLCIIYHFTLKYKPGTLVLVEQTLYITSPVKKRQWWEFLKQLMEKIRLEIVPAAGARSKLNEIVPRAIFYDLIKSTSSRLLRSWVLLILWSLFVDNPQSFDVFERLPYFIVTTTLLVFFWLFLYPIITYPI